jgi:putative serine protease PepD
MQAQAALPALAVAAAIGLAGCGGHARSAHARAASTATPAPAPAAAAGSGGGSASAVQRQFVAVVQRVSPSVVQIQTSQGLGSGIVFDRKGDIVTNAHVVGSSRRFTVTLAGGVRHAATLVGTYPQNDLAVIHLQGATPRPATFADSSKIAVGDFALAIGNPLGLRSSVTEGIVSSVGRTVPEGNGVVLPSAIQTSAAINPGNSGGALVDLGAHVIGIPTLAATDPEFNGAQAPGIGFAIPSNTVRTIAGKLVAGGGQVPQQGRGYLGVEVATLIGGGVAVEQVVAGGPAARAGMRAGDVITAVAGQSTPTADTLTSVLQTLRPGQRVPVQVERQDGSQRTLQITLGSQPG